MSHSFGMGFRRVVRSLVRGRGSRQDRQPVLDLHDLLRGDAADISPGVGDSQFLDLDSGRLFR